MLLNNRKQNAPICMQIPRDPLKIQNVSLDGSQIMAVCQQTVGNLEHNYYLSVRELQKRLKSLTRACKY